MTDEQIEDVLKTILPAIKKAMTDDTGTGQMLLRAGFPLVGGYGCMYELAQQAVTEESAEVMLESMDPNDICMEHILWSCMACLLEAGPERRLVTSWELAVAALAQLMQALNDSV